MTARKRLALYGVALVGAAIASLAGAAIYLGSLPPVFTLPSPSGPYKVGTDVRHVVDGSRRDPYSDDPNSRRELMIQIWYPVDPGARGPIAVYRDKRGTTRENDHLSQVDTDSIAGAPVSRAQTRYPMLLYSPGWDGVRTENTFHAQELASHGYIVVGIDHPYGSEVTVFPDGRIVRTRLVLGDPFSSATAREKFFQTVEREVKIRSDDAKSVVDALERWAADDPGGILTGRIDPGRIGIFGFSLGGAVAAQACWLDRRLKAGINMDGLLVAEVAKEGPRVPFLFLRGEGRQLLYLRHLPDSSDNQFLQLDGMRHFNFSDQQFFVPWPNSDRGLAARLLNRVRLWPNSERAEEAARVINRHLLAFFDAHLKGLK